MSHFVKLVIEKKKTKFLFNPEFCLEVEEEEEETNETRTNESLDRMNRSCDCKTWISFDCYRSY